MYIVSLFFESALFYEYFFWIFIYLFVDTVLIYTQLALFRLKLQECEYLIHFQCLPEPITSLDQLPGGEDDDFYCPGCKIDKSEIVGAGKLKIITIYLPSESM